MRNYSAAFKAHLASGHTTLCSAVVIEPRGGTIECFTDNVSPVTVDGFDCEPLSAYSGSALQQRGDLSVDNLDLVVLLESGGITADKILGGVYDFARFTIYILNYNDPTEFGVLQKGWFGNMTTRDADATVEARDLAQALQQRIGELTSPTCRANLGDIRCGVGLATHTVTGAVTSVTDKTIFRDSGRTESVDHFAYGLLTWATGALNAGLSMEVKSSATDGTFTLVAPLRYVPATGDNYEAYRGCNRLATTCKTVFDNRRRIRAEIFLVGADQLAKFARQ